ncbi:hypothetical protein ACJMK2_030674 [Sinanodonta woodiana]|uniref:Uncharacterized protein n=1 Tax=Sinanodonta woodiana TaxID=1069815 RepID=A0ABD3WXW6_SINWO
MNKIVGLIYLVTLFQERCFAPTTPISPDGCIIDGRHFRPGEDISRETKGLWCFGLYCSETGEHDTAKIESFCYGIYCNTNGTLSSREDWNCST